MMRFINGPATWFNVGALVVTVYAYGWNNTRIAWAVCAVAAVVCYVLAEYARVLRERDMQYTIDKLNVVKDAWVKTFGRK